MRHSRHRRLCADVSAALQGITKYAREGVVVGELARNLSRVDFGRVVVKDFAERKGVDGHHPDRCRG